MNFQTVIRATATVPVLLFALLGAACGGDAPGTIVDIDSGNSDGGMTNDGSRPDAPNADASNSDASVSNCDEGYHDVGAGCVDIDECEDGTDTCDDVSTCTNTEGSFTCGACPEGYIGTGARGCFDIDECAFSVCDPLTTCTNTPGAYTCSACPEGTTGTGATSCTLANGCDENPCDELTTCTPGDPSGYSCSDCPEGYIGTGERGCFDIDECAFSPCDPRTTCSNTAGGFECSACPDGFEFDDTHTCVDIDECATGAATCGALEQCANSDGSYICGTFHRIAAAESHACAVMDDGTIRCWGDGSDGKLGNGTDRQRPSATRTSALGARAVSVSSTSYHTCAQLNDGTVSCWGANWSGQLGDGDVDTARYAPGRTLDLGGPVRSLATGYEHTCVLLHDGTVKCWGSNDAGRLGVDSAASRIPVPTTVDLGGPATALAVGEAHSCAVLEDGSVKCWGANWNRQLGDGTSDNRPAPVPTLSLGEAAVALIAGSNHTCALMESGGMRCWGYNSEGALGDGTTMDYEGNNVATLALGGTVRAFGAGYSHTCVLLGDGTTRCWGANGDGQLGNGTRGDPDPSPGTPISFAETAIDLDAGSSTTCVLFEHDMLRCWGYNGSGQSGEAGLQRSITPTATAPLGGTAISIALGGNGNNFAVLSDGTIRGWGNNGNGQLADGTFVNRASPTPTLPLSTTAVQASAGPNSSCFLLSDGRAWCTGYNGNGQLANGTYDSSATPQMTSPLGGTASNIGMGNNHSCFVLSTGGVSCAGYNGNGQLGNGTNAQTPTPVATMSLAANAQSVSTGVNHTCAVLVDGRVQCWGYGGQGQLGEGSWSGDRWTPVTAVLPGPATKVAAGEYHTCALLADGSVYCWGADWYGQLGDATNNSTPTPVHTLLSDDATDVGVGNNHGCAVLVDGSVECWGGNWNYQLGDGTNTTRNSPSPTGALPGAATMVAGSTDHSCALIDDGTVACWGWNGEGRLGLGYDGNYIPAPRPAIDLSL